MVEYEFDWVDAFSDRPFGGNGCAVVHEGAGLDASVCKAFTRETSLVECTFTGPSKVADIRVRYFLASGEIPFAGHPTIATVAAMRSRGLLTGDRITLETGAGLIPIRIDDGRIEMQQIAPEFGVKPDPETVARAVGLTPHDVIGQPQVVSTGLPFCVTVLKDHDALKKAKLNIEALAEFKRACSAREDTPLEPFLVVMKGASGQGDTFSRLLLPPPNPPEDAFTGSATGAMAAYLWSVGHLDKESFVAEQGHWLGRPGQAQVTRLGAPTAMKGVLVAGKGYVLMSGRTRLPEIIE